MCQQGNKFHFSLSFIQMLPDRIKRGVMIAHFMQTCFLMVINGKFEKGIKSTGILMNICIGNGILPLRFETQASAAFLHSRQWRTQPFLSGDLG